MRVTTSNNELAAAHYIDKFLERPMYVVWFRGFRVTPVTQIPIAFYAVVPIALAIGVLNPATTTMVTP